MVQINHPHHSSSIDSFNIYCHYQLILVKQSSILRKLKKWDDLFELWSKTENGHFLFTLLKKYSPQKTYLELEKKLLLKLINLKKINFYLNVKFCYLKILNSLNLGLIRI